MTHRVRCGDHAAGDDPDAVWIVDGFRTLAAAQDYARRFIRAQIEDLRADTAGPEALREQYFLWGEFAEAEGLDHRAWAEHCIANPARVRADTDYEALEP